MTGSVGIRSNVGESDGSNEPKWQARQRNTFVENLSQIGNLQLDLSKPVATSGTTELRVSEKSSREPAALQWALAYSLLRRCNIVFFKSGSHIPFFRKNGKCAVFQPFYMKPLNPLLLFLFCFPFSLRLPPPAFPMSTCRLMAAILL